MSDFSPKTSLLWLGVVFVMMASLLILTPILKPFLIGLVIAYICYPLVDRFALSGVLRIVSVVFVLLVLSLLFVLIALIIVPMIAHEFGRAQMLIPERMTGLLAQLDQLLQSKGIHVVFDRVTVRDWLWRHVSSVQSVGMTVGDWLLASGGGLLQALAKLVLVPLIVFYVLLDWHRIVGGVSELIPPRWQASVTLLMREFDYVLSGFLRGTLIVMSVLVGYYALSLWWVGLNLFLPVAVITGLLIFIPYVGFTIGFVLAMFAALLQGDGVWSVVGIFVIGNMLESFFLTPFIVGDKVGLHPLAVLFCLLAFGYLFGFVGVLLAIPIGALALVVLRHLRQSWLTSRVYLSDKAGV